MTARPAFTASQRLKCFEDHGAIVLCQETDCDNAMYIKGCEIDHWLALVDGGTHTQDNLRPLCSSCHRRKSAKEHSRNAKAKRIARKRSAHRLRVEGHPSGGDVGSTPTAQSTWGSRKFPEPPPDFKHNWPKRKLQKREKSNEQV